MKKSKLSLAVLAVGAAVLVWARPSHAGSPLFICQSGQPYLWPAGGRNIPFNPDQGDMGPLTNAEAVALVAEAFQAWEDLPTSSVSYVDAGLLPVDVDVTNFFDYFFGLEDGLSPVVFDHDGEIFRLLFGPGSGVGGWAGPELVDVESCTILEARIFLNGSLLTDAVEVKDVAVHEIGHFTNLTHTNVKWTVVHLRYRGGALTRSRPVSSSGSVRGHHRDDASLVFRSGHRDADAPCR